MKTTLGKTVKSQFLQFFGVDTFKFERSGEAAYMAPVQMGSPNNVLGKEPDAFPKWRSASTAVGPTQFFLNVAGSGMDKEFGDRWHTGSCALGHDVCGPGKAGPKSNLEYDADGAKFTVQVDPGVTGQLAIEAFDALKADVGDKCDRSNLAAVYAATHNPIYLPGPSDLCAGDDLEMNPPPSTTTFEIDNSACPTLVFDSLQGSDAQWVTTLSTPSPLVTAPVNSFRKWSRLCTIDIPASATKRTFTISVKQSEGAGSPNLFSLRAGLLKGGVLDVTSTQHVHMTGAGQLVVKTNDTNSTLLFSLAKLGPTAAGRTIHVELYDIADSTTPVQSLTLYPSADTTDGGAPLGRFACTHNPPAGGLKSKKSSCVVYGLNRAQYNGRVSSFDVEIPPGYNCDYKSSTGCWIQMKIEYGAGSLPQDTSSWSVDAKGTPVRLYNS